ncbi:hypothetical protein GQ53DRAFT_751357 [Thozetella sp. PMI_491]|nr:hypothetical protein GQ53DRAFT_751357 [Thozetella sp. PMI_491]
MASIDLVLYTILFLAGFQLRSSLRQFNLWVASVFPLADSRLKQVLRSSIREVALAAFLGYLASFVPAVSEILGRLADRLI